MSWVLDCCKTQKMHLRRKSLSLCDSLHVLYTPQIIQKQANMRRMIRLRDKNKTRCFVPRDRNFRSICVCIFNNSIAHITCTYSSDSNPVPLNVIRATQIAPVFALPPFRMKLICTICAVTTEVFVIPSYWWVFRGLEGVIRAKSVQNSD